ncbi:MAG: hypothetical protein HY291_20140 [Planctomycetes bacterium]|nr:hypothetical protein [Planctomycetota bacterium]
MSGCAALLAFPAGLEPATCGLEICVGNRARSNQGFGCKFQGCCLGVLLGVAGGLPRECFSSLSINVQTRHRPAIHGFGARAGGGGENPKRQRAGSAGASVSAVAILSRLRGMDRLNRRQGRNTGIGYFLLRQERTAYYNSYMKIFRFQVHLLTMILLSLLIGILLFINFIPRTDRQFSGCLSDVGAYEVVSYGWPFPIFWTYSETKDSPRRTSHFTFLALLIDLLICLLILASFVILSEWIYKKYGQILGP